MKRTISSIFEDLQLPDAPERLRKTQLAMIINTEIDHRGGTQHELACLLGVPQPRVSMLRNYRLDHFSVDRLLDMLAALGLHVEIRIDRASRGRRAEVSIVPLHHEEDPVARFR